MARASEESVALAASAPGWEAFFHDLPSHWALVTPFPWGSNQSPLLLSSLGSASASARNPFIGICSQSHQERILLLIGILNESCSTTTPSKWMIAHLPHYCLLCAFTSVLLLLVRVPSIFVSFFVWKMHVCAFKPGGKILERDTGILGSFVLDFVKG